MEKISTILTATVGTAGTVSAAAAGDVILAYVSIGVTVATTILNFILFARKKWADTTKEIESDKNKDKEK